MAEISASIALGVTVDCEIESVVTCGLRLKAPAKHCRVKARVIPARMLNVRLDPLRHNFPFDGTQRSMYLKYMEPWQGTLYTTGLFDTTLHSGGL